ncbi:MAG: zinc ribbon domain-containing protein [Promethearchaeota archaeon]|nr:MAG: zinc ribbon domain-containing protein [Candidatus Lokiarchaeota archaeon]
MCLLPLISYAVADDDKPSYCGINEGDSYIWSTEFDKGPFEDYLEDFGYSEQFAENFTDRYFDGFNWDEDVEAWRVYILQIKDEKDMDYKGDEIEYVPYLFNYYETEDRDANDWDDIEKNARGAIYEYDDDLYLDSTLWAMGLYYMICGTDVDWDELADNLEEEFDDYNEEGDADAEERIYFFREEECGISTEWESKETSKTEEFESVSRYTREGVTLYYEWTYDGDTIIKLELEGAYFYENWWWILLIIILVIAGIVTAVTVVIVVRRKRKVEKIAPPEVAKKLEVPAQRPVEAPPGVKFCPMCGKQVKVGTNFCNSCGARID